MKKVILISGGSDGIGLATAKLCTSDYDVVILARNEDNLKQASSEIGCEYVVCDVTDWQQVQNAVMEVVERRGGIDGLVNNAGQYIAGELDDCDEERIKSIYDVNVLGVTYLAKAVIPVMKKQESGRIINISSQAGLCGRSERSIYNASKWAVTGLTQCLKYELAKYNISVSGVFPGKVKTDIFARGGVPDKDLTNALRPKDVASTVKHILDQPDNVVLTEVGITHMKTNVK